MRTVVSREGMDYGQGGQVYKTTVSIASCKLMLQSCGGYLWLNSDCFSAVPGLARSNQFKPRACRQDRAICMVYSDLLHMQCFLSFIHMRLIDSQIASTDAVSTSVVFQSYSEKGYCVDYVT